LIQTPANPAAPAGSSLAQGQPAAEPKSPLSVVIPAKNEEANLAACLASVAWAAEVWVVDSASTDCTAAIAEANGARCVQFAPDRRDPSLKKKNWALENLPFAHDWVLLLDADERVPETLRAEIAGILRHPPAGLAGYYVNRRLIFLGRWIRHCGWYPSWNLRLFRHRLGRYERLGTAGVANAGDVEVHEHVILQGQAGYLRHDLLHEDFKSIYHFVERHNRYSNWEAQVYENLATGGPAEAAGEEQLAPSLFGGPVQRKRWLKRLWVTLPGRPLLRFLWMYVFRLGFLDGRPGLIFCSLMTFHEAVIDAKRYERRIRAQGPRSEAL
jgi:glycosyltransferase involved in cell wall biosynthesis